MLVQGGFLPHSEVILKIFKKRFFLPSCHLIPHGLMARILGFHPRGPGSIPGVGEHFFLNSKFVSSMRLNMNEIFNKMKIESTVYTCFYLNISKSTTILSKLFGVLSVLFLKIGGLGT